MAPELKDASYPERKSQGKEVESEIGPDTVLEGNAISAAGRRRRRDAQLAVETAASPVEKQ